MMEEKLGKVGSQPFSIFKKLLKVNGTYGLKVERWGKDLRADNKQERARVAMFHRQHRC